MLISAFSLADFTSTKRGKRNMANWMNAKAGSLIIAGLFVVAGSVGATTTARAQEQVVYINSSGGVLDDINRKIHWDPFTQATGIKVVASAPVDNAKLKAMVTSGNVEWDIT